MSDNVSLTPQEVADILKIAKNTVYELVKRGELNSYRAGKKIRFDLKDVEEYKSRTSSMKDSNVYNRSSAEQSAYASAAVLNTERLAPSIIISGQDIMLDILVRHYQNHYPNLSALRSYDGSYNGLYNLYLGKIQVATTHLWDGDSNQYNINYVRRMLPGIPAIIIHLACRMQGFFVAKGNPKGLKDWNDFKREDLVMINREKGAGTRVLLDEHLRLLNISPWSIKGYDNEATSHLAVAGSVARGQADVGIGSEKASLQVKDIDFIPLQMERFEMVVKKEDSNQAWFEALMGIIRTPGFRAELEGIGGYELRELGQIITET
ncbi:MAG: helix-turn-helix transcriptional regulator [Syntrophomonadaceae bacterium]